MTDRQQHVVDFYTRHPISAEHIVQSLQRKYGEFDTLAPAALYEFDQDHYGGLAANQAIVERIGLRPGQRVVDFCAGLGGPARWFAAEHQVRVTGIEITPHRVAGARRLTELTGLTGQVEIIEGDVMQVPLPDECADAVVSQEALLHVPDKSRAIAQAARILIPGGRLCFTDWQRHRPLTAQEEAVMWQGIAAQQVYSTDQYREAFGAAGLDVVSHDDLTDEWAVVLARRRDMYTALRADALAAGKPAGDEHFYSAYVTLVELVQQRVLGGVRWTVEKG